MLVLTRETKYTKKAKAQSKTNKAEKKDFEIFFKSVSLVYPKIV